MITILGATVEAY